MAYLHDTNRALTAYRKAVELDPDNADGWNRLGHVLRRTGELTQAEAAYRKVLALGEAQQDKEWQAKAIGNLGIMHWTRGDLDKAEEMFRKSLAISEALGLKEVTTDQYTNLGIVHEQRGDLAQAEAAWKKSLRLYQEIGMPDAKDIQQWLDDLARQKGSTSR